MMLVDHEIIKAYTDKNIGITPFNSKQVNPNSYDVTLFNEIKRHKPSKYIVDIYNKESIDDAFFNEVFNEYIVLMPGEKILGSTNEYISLSNGFVASIEGKSSLSRLFLTIHQTGGWIDTGFEGNITLEIENGLERPIRLYKDMKIAQLVFFKVSKCDIPYNEKIDSKYIGQKGPTGSMYYENKKY